MRVLVVCPFVPWPLDSGGRIRTFHLLRAVAREVDDVEVEAFCVADERDPAPLERRLAAEIGRVRLFPRSRATLARRLARAKVERWFESAALSRALAERFASDPPDLVHVDEMSVLRSVPDPAPCPLVVHHSKLDLEFHRRTSGGGLAARFDRTKLVRLEHLAARRARHQVVCSPGDRALLVGRHPRLVVSTVPSGFDPEHFRPDPSVERARDELLVLGSLDYAPNEDGLELLAREVLPRLEHAVRVRVVGRDPSARVRALCAASPRLDLVGEVEDVRPYLLRAAALVVPLRIGGGTRLKVVEALATGTPVVSTRVGAEGLDLCEEHLDLADGPEELARAVDRVLSDPRAAGERAERGRRFVSERLGWPVLARRLVEAWRAALG